MKAAHRFEIVISAENHHYVAWQVLLWHHVALTKMGRAPLVVVHGDEPELVEPYHDLIAHGGRVQRAPNYRVVNGVMYAARNTAATLLHAQTSSDYLVICDPDMLVAGHWPLDTQALHGNQASLDSVEYMVHDSSTGQWLRPACRRAKIGLRAFKKFTVPGGVPHIVPRALQQPLAKEWLALHDVFHPSDGNSEGQTADQLDWHSLASMWSLLMAMYRLGIEPVQTRWCMTNFRGGARPEEDGFPERPLLHYCYGDSVFNKRDYLADRGGRGSVWNARARSGTIHGLVTSALREAGEFYGYRKNSPQRQPARRKRAVRRKSAG